MRDQYKEFNDTYTKIYKEIEKEVAKRKHKVELYSFLLTWLQDQITKTRKKRKLTPTAKTVLNEVLNEMTTLLYKTEDSIEEASALFSTIEHIKEDAEDTYNSPLLSSEYKKDLLKTNTRNLYFYTSDILNKSEEFNQYID